MTEPSRSAASIDSICSGSLPRSDRAISSRSSASCVSRSTSCEDQRTASRSSSSDSPWRSASSSSVRRSASGVRSSCPASATKSRSRSRAASSRSSISLSVLPSNSTSSPVEGTGRRSPGFSAEIAAARRRIDSTWRSDSPARKYPNSDASTSAIGPAMSNSSRKEFSVSARFWAVAPTTSTILRPLRSTGVASRRDGSSSPGVEERRAKIGPRSAARSSACVKSAVLPTPGVASRTRPRESTSSA